MILKISSTFETLLTSPHTTKQMVALTLCQLKRGAGTSVSSHHFIHGLLPATSPPFLPHLSGRFAQRSLEQGLPRSVNSVNVSCQLSGKVELKTKRVKQDNQVSGIMKI